MDATAGAFANMTSFLPSPADLLMVFPRLFDKVSSYGEVVRSGGSVIAEPTMANVTNSTIATTAGKFVQESVAAAAAASAASSGSTDEISMFQAFKNVASFFSYMTSKWAIATFAIVSLVLLNPLCLAANIRIAGNTTEPHPVLCLQPRTAFLRPNVYAPRSLYSPSHAVRAAKPQYGTSYTMSDVSRLVYDAVRDIR